jgi:hypothetical protein
MKNRNAVFLASFAALATYAVASHAQTTAPTQIADLKGYVLRVVHPGDMMTMDYRTDRVTIHVDKDEKITEVKFY